jgi:membrane-associated PAP2 superfamily phosphatase
MNARKTDNQRRPGQTAPGFYLRQAVFLLLAALALWLVFDYTDADMNISRLFFDYSTQSWPYYNAFFTSKVGYLWIKLAIWVYGLALLAGYALSFGKPALAKYRKLLLFLVLAMITVPSEIAVLKDTLHKSRPSQVFEFGGTMPHVKLGEFLPDQPTANNWPGGHASAGATLLSLYFAGYHLSPRWKRAGVLLGVGVSQFMGFVQVMRGQHFFSHNLWTLWFAWLTILTLYYLFDRSPWPSQDKNKSADGDK